MTSPSNRPATTTTSTDEARTPALDLSLTKVAGGALTAVTTAVVASFFGVTGTLTGAAFGSVVSSVAAAVYAASFKTAGTRFRATRALVTQGQGTEAGAGEDPADPTSVPPTLVGRSAPLDGETVVLPAAGDQGGESAGAAVPAARSRRSTARRGPGRPRWTAVALLAGFAFVIALGFITVSELFLGHPISNSTAIGDTSVSLAARGGAPGPATKHREPDKSTTTSDTPTGSESESPAPTDGATTTATGDRSDQGTTSTSGDQGDPGDQGPTASPPDSGDGRDRQDRIEPATPTDSPAVAPGKTAASISAPSASS
jgi:hypothetical protein